jgi:hypothetical protein
MAESRNIDDDWEFFCEKNNDKSKNNIYNDTMTNYTDLPTTNSSKSASCKAPLLRRSGTNKKTVTNDIYNFNRDDEGVLDNNDANAKQSNDNTKSNDKIKDDTQINNPPKCSDIYISTKTQIAYFNQPINLVEVFWCVPINPYHAQLEGVIKKSMKFNTLSQIELDNNTERTAQYKYVDQHIILQINNPSGRIQFKDVRKISIGLCKKDILSTRDKKNNSAFYNCFVVIVRILQNEIFREIHVKVFNTGKMEIPGIQSDEMLNRVLSVLTEIIRPFIKDSLVPLEYLKEKSEIVLINSNFKCGYYINRVKMYDLLKYTYNINCAYDPCSYPGIQCEFYYDTAVSVQTGCQPLYIENNKKALKEEKKDKTKNAPTVIKVSFMIFRTGSVLIVGKCDEIILRDIYVFIKNILETQHEKIESKEAQVNPPTKTDEKKRRTKMLKICVEKCPNTFIMN